MLRAKYFRGVMATHCGRNDHDVATAEGTRMGLHKQPTELNLP